MTHFRSLETNPRNRALFAFLYASGMRVSELVGLCWRDLQANSDGGQVTVFGKGDVTRAVKYGRDRKAGIRSGGRRPEGT